MPEKTGRQKIASPGVFSRISSKLMKILSRYSVQHEDVVGVDITPTYIRVAQMEQKQNQWMLTRLGYRFVDGMQTANDIVEHADVYADQLQRVIASSKIKTLNAAVSIPVSSAIIKVISLPLMTDEELEQAIEYESLWENVVQLTEQLDEYSVFWQVINRYTSTDTMDLLFVASKLSDVDNYVEIVRQAGLNPVVADIRCFTIRNAFDIIASGPLEKAPVAIIEFGPFENYLLIVRGGAPFISDVFMSDQDKVMILQKGLDNGSAARLIERCAMQIAPILTAYNAKSKDQQPVRKLFVVSLLPEIESCISILSEKLSECDVEVFNPIEAVVIPEHLVEKTEAELNPSVFATPLGLATRKMDIFGYYKYVTGVKNINMLPNRADIAKTERKKIISKLVLAAATIIILVAGGFSFVSINQKKAVLHTAVVEYNMLVGLKDEKLNVLMDLESKIKAIEKSLATGKQVHSNQIQLYRVIRSVIAAIPRGVWLTSMTYSGGNEFSIDGDATSDQKILKFINNLNQEDSIYRSQLISMTHKTRTDKMKRKIENKHFNLRCTMGQPGDDKR